MMIFADELANSAKDTGFRTNQHLITSSSGSTSTSSAI